MSRDKKYVKNLSKYGIGSVHAETEGATKSISGYYKVIGQGTDSGGHYVLTKSQAKP